MKYIIIGLFTISLAYLSANTQIKDKNEEKNDLTQKVAFKKELDAKKQRKEKLKVEIEKLKKLLIEEQNKLN